MSRHARLACALRPCLECRHVLSITEASASTRNDSFHYDAAPVSKTAAALLVLLVIAASGCGGSSTTTTTNAAGKVTTSCHIRFAKTKFAVHSGIAAAAFYRYIYRPYRAGAFKKNAPGRRKALLKAAASAAVAVHELRQAARAARCDGPALKKIAPAIGAVLAPLETLRALKTGGGFDAIAAARAAFEALTSKAVEAGTPVRGNP